MFKNKNVFGNFFKQIKKNEKVCIFGSNDVAEKIFDNLSTMRKDVEVKFFLDSNNSGEFKGLPLYKADELINHKDEIDAVIVSSFSWRFYIELLVKKCGINNVFLMDEKLFGQIKKDIEPEWDMNKSAKVFKTKKDRDLYKLIAKGRQDRIKYLSEIYKYYHKRYPERYQGAACPKEHYLEYLNKNAIKTVIDGGGYDGFNSVVFSEALTNCEKIFMFEPCYDTFKDDILQTLIENDEKIEIVKKGLWSNETTLEFREETQAKVGSGIVEARQVVTRPHKIIKIDTIDLDKFAQDRDLKIDFIKLDVENAELDVLQGAEKILVEQRPQLAISIYHSDEHFYTIPLYLKNLLKDYEFRFGHYSMRYTESVIYAIPKELV